MVHNSGDKHPTEGNNQMRPQHRDWIKVSLLYMLLMVCCVPGFSSESKAIRQALANQGFSGLLIGKVWISELGIIAVGSTRYHILYYVWEESEPHGDAIHASYRIILMTDDNQYIGSYIIEDKPSKLTRNSILFNYDESNGNAIVFDKNGPPKKVYLDRYLLDLVK